jgi:hypothetical protein
LNLCTCSPVKRLHATLLADAQFPRISRYATAHVVCCMYIGSRMSYRDSARSGTQRSRSTQRTVPRCRLFSSGLSSTCAMTNPPLRCSETRRLFGSQPCRSLPAFTGERMDGAIGGVWLHSGCSLTCAPAPACCASMLRWYAALAGSGTNWLLHEYVLEFASGLQAATRYRRNQVHRVLFAAQ